MKELRTTISFSSFISSPSHLSNSNLYLFKLMSSSKSALTSKQIGVHLEDAVAQLELLKKELAKASDCDPEEAKAKLEAHKLQLENERSAFESEKTQLIITQSQLKSAQSQLEDAKSQLECAHSQLEGARAQLETAMAHLEAAKAQTTIDGKRLEAAKASLEAAKIRSTAAIKQLEAAKSRYNSAKDLLDATACRTENKVAELEIKVSELESEKSRNLTVISLLEDEKSNLVSEVNRNTKEIEGLFDIVREMEKQLIQCCKNNKAQEVEIQGLKKKVTNLKNQLNQCRAEKKALEDEIAYMQESSESDEEVMDPEQTQRLENELIQIKSELEKTKQENKSLQDELFESRRELEQIMKEKKSLQDELTECRGQLGQIKKENKSLQDENKKLKENSSASKYSGNPKVFFDFTIRGVPKGRIVMELFADTTPCAAENFRALCTGEKGFTRSGKALHYKGTWFEYINNVAILGGHDTSDRGNNGPGESIYGTKTMPVENFVRKHTGPGDISMMSSGDNISHGCGFIINTVKNSDWNGGLVVIGKMVQGMEVLNAIVSAFPTPQSLKGILVIADCGQLQ